MDFDKRIFEFCFIFADKISYILKYVELDFIIFLIIYMSPNSNPYGKVQLVYRKVFEVFCIYIYMVAFKSLIIIHNFVILSHT